jgi:hypothetical protein
MADARFYEFYQNNSGGFFVDNMLRYMWIAALSEQEACEIAEENCVYFNGSDYGRDCQCCGDRWYRPESPITREEIEKFVVKLPESEYKIVEKKG